MYDEGCGETSLHSPKADSGGEAGRRLEHHLSHVERSGDGGKEVSRGVVLPRA